MVMPGTHIACHMRNPQLILPMAVPPPEVDDIEFHDPNCWASTGAMAWQFHFKLWLRSGEKNSTVFFC